MHSVIIGNGIVALATAFRLARQAGADDKITIIGDDTRKGSATLAAAAMLNSFAEIEVGSLKSELDLYRFELSHLATRMWPKFEEELIMAGGSHLPKGCSECQGVRGGGCFERGTYVVNNAAADDLDDENFDAIAEGLQQFDEPFSLVSPNDIPNYMPEQKFRALRALYIPNEGWFNPRLMLEKLDAVLSLFPQIERVSGIADHLTQTNDKINSVVLMEGKIVQGDQYLLATGATVSKILDASALGIDVQRIFYGVGVSIEIKSKDHPHTHCVRTPNRGLACGIYTVPYYQQPDMPQDHIIVGATNLLSATPLDAARLSNVESLTRAAIEQINHNFYRAELVRINVGWRPTSQDTYPLLGKTSIANLTIATGTKRDGFHMAPVLSQFLAATMRGEKTDERMNVFAPERKVMRNLTREEAVSKAVRHQISAAYQHGFTPPKSRMPEAIVQMTRDTIERLHDQVGAKDWGIPPEMLDMYRYGHAKGDK